MNEINRNHIIDALFQNKIVEIARKKTEQSPVFPLDLHLETLCSYPQLLKEIADGIYSEIKKTQFDLIVGPYNDIPLATTLSISHNVPMLFLRNERKGYGMEKLIEGHYEPDLEVIMVDVEIVDPAKSLQLLGRLEGAGLKVKGYVVFLDRDQGAIEFICRQGYACSRLISLNEMMFRGVEHGDINKNELQELRKVMENLQTEFRLKHFSASVS